MANGHGGPRTPAHPAPVSGPGALSRRTDGGPAQVLSAAPDQAYGDKKQELTQQRIAPMGAAQPLPPAPPPSQEAAAPQGPPPFNGVPLDAPTQRPNEPITAGSGTGPGPGPAFIPNYAAQPTGAMTQLLQGLAATNATGVIADLLQKAQQRGV